ncbi:MAG: tRNA (guanosine(46)-N7)-methyltransferase TrmB [Bacilli bacterium]|nr:tRNA (guanosine(46)-N7)-methyltransferase TrmB [Bacilli bacterium]
MRLRNIKGADEYVNSSAYVLKDYENLKGNFKSVFKNNNPIHLEIGTGKGDFIIGMALKYPDINFIGVEKYASVLYKLIGKIENMDIPNLKIIMMDATNIDKIFAHEVDTLYLNFSDPWPKERHYKRRLTSTEFLKRYENIFRGDNHIIQKTDNRGLFEFSLKEFVLNNYKIEDISLDLHNDDCPDNVETEYEKKFSAKGNPIYKVEVKK